MNIGIQSEQELVMSRTDQKMRPGTESVHQMSKSDIISSMSETINGQSRAAKLNQNPVRMQFCKERMNESIPRTKRRSHTAEKRQILSDCQMQH